MGNAFGVTTRLLNVGLLHSMEEAILRIMILAKHYETGTPVAIEIEGGRFSSIRPVQVDFAQEESLPWIAPGLIDIQINGFAGVDFNFIAPGDLDKSPATDDGFVPGLDLAEEQWQRATQGLYASGCTGFFATLITTSPDRYSRLLTKWTACLQQNPRNGLGIHLEGPWLNPEPGYRGAHPPHFMTEPSLDQVREWLSISGGALRMITLAPEVNPHAAEKAIEFLRAHGITCFIGHSGAMGDVLRGAITAGAQGWTHLGNAAPRNPDKFDNVILHVLAESALYASLIPDGLHVPEHAFRALSWALGDQLLFTTDAMAAAGVDLRNAHEQFTLGETVVQLGSDGSARLPDSGRLAGSTLTPFEGVIRAAAMSRLPMAHIWNIYSQRIANLLGFQHGLHEGLSADFCLFSWNEQPELWATYHRGRQEFCNGTNWA